MPAFLAGMFARADLHGRCKDRPPNRRDRQRVERVRTGGMVKRSEERVELGHEQTGNTAYGLAAPDRAIRLQESILIRHRINEHEC